MTTRPVRSIIDDQLDDLVVNLPRRMALTIKKGRKCLGVRR